MKKNLVQKVSINLEVYCSIVESGTYALRHWGCRKAHARGLSLSALEVSVDSDLTQHAKLGPIHITLGVNLCPRLRLDLRLDIRVRLDLGVDLLHLLTRCTAVDLRMRLSLLRVRMGLKASMRPDLHLGLYSRMDTHDTKVDVTSREEAPSSPRMTSHLSACSNVCMDRDAHRGPRLGAEQGSELGLTNVFLVRPDEIEL